MRSGPGEARPILLLHIISARPSKQPLMVRTFLKVYMELGSSFLFLQEQIKDIIIIISPQVVHRLILHQRMRVGVHEVSEVLVGLRPYCLVLPDF